MIVIRKSFPCIFQFPIELFVWQNLYINLIIHLELVSNIQLLLLSSFSFDLYCSLCDDILKNLNAYPVGFQVCSEVQHALYWTLYQNLHIHVLSKNIHTCSHEIVLALTHTHTYTHKDQVQAQQPWDCINVTARGIAKGQAGGLSPGQPPPAPLATPSFWKV